MAVADTSCVGVFAVRGAKSSSSATRGSELAAGGQLPGALLPRSVPLISGLPPGPPALPDAWMRRRVKSLPEPPRLPEEPLKITRACAIARGNEMNRFAALVSGNLAVHLTLCLSWFSTWVASMLSRVSAYGLVELTVLREIERKVRLSPTWLNTMFERPFWTAALAHTRLLATAFDHRVALPSGGDAGEPPLHPVDGDVGVFCVVRYHVHSRTAAVAEAALACVNACLCLGELRGRC